MTATVGYLRVRDLRAQQLRAVLHQLRQRETAAEVHTGRLQERAGENQRFTIGSL